MTFVSKQCIWHQCSNTTSRWMTSMFIPYELMKSRFCIWLLLPNHGPSSLWCGGEGIVHFITPLCTFIAMCLPQNVNTYWTNELIVNKMNKLSLSSGIKGKKSIKVISVNCCSKVFNKSI
jgi:hypothetical protein